MPYIFILLLEPNTSARRRRPIINPPSLELLFKLAKTKAE
jgi:hypothetical protein